MLDVYIPNDNLTRERTYIIQVLLSNFLGVVYTLKIEKSLKEIILIGGNKTLKINDSFFSLCNKNGWLTDETMPLTPLQAWTCPTSLTEKVVQKEVPVIYGDAKVVEEEHSISMGLDVFGSSFFMLSRYEEAIIKEKDVHGRFPAKASTAFKEDFLHRPIVNEYLEILWFYMKQLWPDLKRKNRKFKMLVSCDVDHIWHRPSNELFYLFRKLAGDLIKRRSTKFFINSIQTFIKVKKGSIEFDPFNTFNFIMTCCEKSDLKAAFYFITAKSAGLLDGYYDINDIRTKELIKEINSRGHEIGLHLSYNSYLSPEQSIKEANILKLLLQGLQIEQKPSSGRQHYLRWETPITARNWENAGYKYDSSLAYAEYLGFRCGTCYEYSFYDIFKRQQLDLIERPLIVMDCTGLEYMKLSSDEALLRYKELKSICKLYKGNFTLLWHNSYFLNVEFKKIFIEIINH